MSERGRGPAPSRVTRCGGHPVSSHPVKASDTIKTVNRFGSPRLGLERGLLLLGVTVLLAACGGSGSSTAASSAPSIANLRVSYVPSTPIVGQPAQVVFFVDVVDPNGDWVGGSCLFLAGNVELPIQTSGLPANATSGTAQCVLNETFTNIPLKVQMVVVDKAGNQSNTLSGTVSVEGRRQP